MSENLWFSDVSGGKETERWAKTGWRSNEIVTENYFCARHKNRWKHNQHFGLLYFTINLQFGTSNWLSTRSKVSLFFMNGIYLVSSSLEIERKLIQREVYYNLFIFWLKINDLKTFRSIATANNLFSSVNVIGTTCFDKCFYSMR